MTKHHRIPKSKTPDKRGGAIVSVPSNKHEAYHLLFDNKNPDEIAKILNDTWIDPNWVMIAIKKETIK